MKGGNEITVYFDQAATGYPKPKEVMRRVSCLMCSPLGNPGRSSHKTAVFAADTLKAARDRVAAHFGLADRGENVIFTQNASEALNMAILGTALALYREGGRFHTVTSLYEHNSVLRPLYYLEKSGITDLSFLEPAISDDCETLRRLYGILTPETKLAVLTAKSNTNGLRLPTDAIAERLRDREIIFISDGSQAVGNTRFDLKKSGIDIICFPGHKGLFGLLGSGALVINPDIRLLPEPIFSGGNGLLTDEHFMPDFMPERLEVGTPPLITAASLAAGIDFVDSVGTEYIDRKEKALQKRLFDNISTLPGIKIYGYFPSSILLFNLGGKAPSQVSEYLDSHGIASRCGFHCAPLAHRLLETGPNGAVRLSLGLFNSPREVDYVSEKIARLCFEK